MSLTFDFSELDIFNSTSLFLFGAERPQDILFDRLRSISEGQVGATLVFDELDYFQTSGRFARISEVPLVQAFFGETDGFPDIGIAEGEYSVRQILDIFNFEVSDELSPSGNLLRLRTH